MNLRVAGVGERGALFVGAPGRGDVAALGVGRQVEHVAVPARGQQHRVARERLDVAALHVAGDDAGGATVDRNHVEHLAPGEHLDLAGCDHARQLGVHAEQQLLAGLALGVERARHQGPAEGAVGQNATVLASEGHALGDALVDDVGADFGQPVHVGFAGPEVTTLDGVVKQPEHAVAVVLVVLGRVDTALGRNAVGSARAVLVAEAGHVETELGQRCRGRATGEAAADDDEVELALVGRVDELDVELVLLPLLIERAAGHF